MERRKRNPKPIRRWGFDPESEDEEECEEVQTVEETEESSSSRDEEEGNETNAAAQMMESPASASGGRPPFLADGFHLITSETDSTEPLAFLDHPG